MVADRALEEHTLDRIRGEMLDANRLIAQATGVTPVTFAYPCGQKFVGRGAGVTSYVPVVHELFLAGRGWLDEAPNDPAFVDRAQIFGYPMDDVEFSELKPAVDDAIAEGQWLVLAGHDIGETPGRAGDARVDAAGADCVPAGAVTRRVAGHGGARRGARQSESRRIRDEPAATERVTGRAIGDAAALAHLQLAAAVAEPDLVHQLVDQEDAAPARLEHVVGVQRVGHAARVEACARDRGRRP